MHLRYLPPVSSPVSGRALTRAAVVGVRSRGGNGSAESVGDDVVTALRERFGAVAVTLTDSGTSALVIALRTLIPQGGTVALPAYGCVDLIAAAIRAGVRVRLYDIDPGTLGPDFDSLRSTLQRGAEAVVVTHLYGYPVDMHAVRAVTDAAGVRVIEDAAQHAGARVGGRPVGSIGPVTVLSFGRGKGTTGGRGGAVFATTAGDAAVATAIQESGRGSGSAGVPTGWGDWGRAAAQWAFGRPWLYGIPASIPTLGLGETVYRPAGEPGRLSLAAATLVARAIARVDADRARRAERAAWYVDRLAHHPTLRLVQPIADAAPGYLRFPVLSASAHGKREAAPWLGVVRTYPLPLAEEAAAGAVLRVREPLMRGAREICARLFTLPTHAAVSDADADRVVEWARSS